MREQIKREVESIVALDELEKVTKAEVISWIESGAELCRTKKPDVPNKHLVSYFVLVDGDYILLVDHRKAELWLPTGGHVEAGEHPRMTVLREVVEELSIQGEFLSEFPIFITSTLTVGKTAGHTDISLWYILKGSRGLKLLYEQAEFHCVKWFHKDKIPLDRTDPQLTRFLKKIYGETIMI